MIQHQWKCSDTSNPASFKQITYILKHRNKAWESQYFDPFAWRSLAVMQYVLYIISRLSFPLPLSLGESVDDCGGGYSESIAEMCDELENGSLPLLIQTPNGRDESGSNRDCFILSPNANTPLHQNMFRWLSISSTYCFDEYVHFVVLMQTH